MNSLNDKIEQILRYLARWGAIVALCGLTAGAASNQLVKVVNQGYMPVYVDICEGNADVKMGGDHICAGVHTHFGLLADWIRQGDDVYSPGDILIETSADAGFALGGLFLISAGALLIQKCRRKKFLL